MACTLWYLKGSNSEIFMEEAYKRMTERGYAIGNCDVTLILQRPKVRGGIRKIVPQGVENTTYRV